MIELCARALYLSILKLMFLIRPLIFNIAYVKLASTKELQETAVSNKMIRPADEPSRNLNTRRQSRTSPGFTIVELLVVIVVIGILAAITIVAYNGIQQRATGASLQSDLKGASKQLALYQVDNSAYPTSNDCSTGATPAPPKICLKSSPGNSYTYTYNNAATPQTFSLTATNTNGTAYNVTDSTAIVVDPWGANWYSGIAATVLAGKHVYKTDLGLLYAYKTTNDAVVSPQGAIGLDPNYPSNMSLVSPQTYPGVDFSAYPAQNACKAIGGRLANMQELLAIYAGSASYGNNFQVGTYWSSTEWASSSAYNYEFGSGLTFGGNKTAGRAVRCVSG